MSKAVSQLGVILSEWPTLERHLQETKSCRKTSSRNQIWFFHSIFHALWTASHLIDKNTFYPYCWTNREHLVASVALSLVLWKLGGVLTKFPVNQSVQFFLKALCQTISVNIILARTNGRYPKANYSQCLSFPQIFTQQLLSCCTFIVKM